MPPLPGGEGGGGARAPLNAPVAPSNFCREPKYVLFDMNTEHFHEAYEDALGLPGKKS